MMASASSQSMSEKTNYAEVVKAGLPQVKFASLATPSSMPVFDTNSLTNNNIPITTVPLSALTSESVPSTAIIMESAPSKFFNMDNTYFSVNVKDVTTICSSGINNSNNNKTDNAITKLGDAVVNYSNNNNNNNNKESITNKTSSSHERFLENETSKIYEEINCKSESMMKEQQTTCKHNSASLSAMAANAKPYIPSYLAAAKRAVGLVKLDGVPVRTNNEQGNAKDAWCSSTVSTSLIDPESNSSWADDDESFLQTVARQQDAMRIKMINSDKDNYNTTTNNNNNSNNNSNNNDNNNTNTNSNHRSSSRRNNVNNMANNNNNNNSKNNTNSNNRFAFQYVNEDEEEYNCSTISRRNRERNGEVHSRGGKRGNWRNKNHSNQGQKLGQWRGKGNNNTNNSNMNIINNTVNSSSSSSNNNLLSGGRFDVLANPRFMRHL